MDNPITMNEPEERNVSASLFVADEIFLFSKTSIRNFLLSPLFSSSFSYRYRLTSVTQSRFFLKSRALSTLVVDNTLLVHGSDVASRCILSKGSLRSGVFSQPEIKNFEPAGSSGHQRRSFTLDEHERLPVHLSTGIQRPSQEDRSSIPALCPSNSDLPWNRPRFVSVA